MGNKELTYNLGQVNHVPHIFEQPLCNDESPRQRLLRLLNHNLFQHSLQILRIVMFVPPNRAPRYLNTLSNSIIDRSIRNDNVASLRKCRYDTRDGGECLSIDYACRSSQVCCYICFGLDMYILCAVKPRGAAGTNPVGAKNLDSFLFQSFVTNKIVEIVRSEVCDCAAI